MIERTNMSAVCEKNVLGAKENKSTTKTITKGKIIRLIKVPKFVVNQWMKCESGQVVGLLDFENEDVSNLYIRKEETSDDVRKLTCNKNVTVNTYLLKQKKIKLKAKNYISGRGKGSNENDLRKKGTENYKKKGKEYDSMSKKSSSIKLMNGNNIVKKEEEAEEGADEHNISILCANVVKKCDNTYAFLPVLDKDYSKILKERHYHTNIKKQRATIIETRNEENIDSENTLFKFYTAQDRFNMKHASDKGRRAIQLNNYRSNNDKVLSKNVNTKNVVDANRSNTSTVKNVKHNAATSSANNKHKGKHTKKMHIFDADKAKITMFRIFEREGSKGVPFSVFSKSFNIPPNHIKNILEEIAVKRKRNIDKKSVYFLKDFV